MEGARDRQDPQSADVAWRCGIDGSNQLLGIDVPRGVASVNFMGPQAHAAGDEELSTLCERVSGRLTGDAAADPKRQRSAP